MAKKNPLRVMVEEALERLKYICLTAEQAQAYVDGTASETDRHIANAHRKVCVVCDQCLLLLEERRAEEKLST